MLQLQLVRMLISDAGEQRMLGLLLFREEAVKEREEKNFVSKRRYGVYMRYREARGGGVTIDTAGK